MKTFFTFHGRKQTSKQPSSWAMLVMMLVLVVGLIGPYTSVAADAGLKQGTRFQYKYHETVDTLTGTYDGYSENTDGTGTYTVQSVSADNVQMRAKYRYYYSNNEYKSETTSQDISFSFSKSTRHYTSTMIDLDDDEYISQPPADLCIWLWVSPSVSVGDHVCILDEDWTVTNLDAHIWSKYVPKHDLIEVIVKGDDNRNDDYGSMYYTYTDKLYFDKDTGMFVAERYDESDSGTWQGQSGGFHMKIEIDVVESSYEISIDWAMVLGIAAATILTFLGVCYLIYRIRWRSHNYEVRNLFSSVGNTRVKVRRVWKKDQFPKLPNNATDFFMPYLDHWVEKALVSGDRVAVAIDAQYGLVGVAFYVKEGKIGTVLCKHTELTELLRSYIGCKDFFTESKHNIDISSDMSQDPYLMAQLNQFGTQAFNVFETHNVYRLDEIRPTFYDADIVRPMKDADVPIVVDLAQKVYRGKAKNWINGNLKAGDLGYVAIVDGRVVGFGFACVCGSFGRLHTLGVDPAYRGRGIAKELHRARLEAMRLMGVRTVVDEIADWNLPSIRISTLSGFQPIGKMYVETVRTKRIKKDIVRR